MHECCHVSHPGAQIVKAILWSKLRATYHLEDDSRGRSLIKHHLGLGLQPRFGKMVAVEYTCDKPVEAIVADNRLPLIVGGGETDKSFDHLSQRLASATAADERAQVLKQPLVDGLQAPLKPLG